MLESTPPQDWRTVLREQGRSMAWLADRTGKPRRAVYGYSQGDMTPPADWLDKVEELLGVPVVDRVAEAIERARAEVAS
jgi:predicted transcriptional regulator